MKEETRGACGCYRLLSIDRDAFLLLSKPSWSARVYSCFDRALNLVDNDENLVTLLTALRQNGPFRALLDTLPDFSFREWNLQPGSSFIAEGSVLHRYPNLHIDMRGSEVWSEAWPPSPVLLSRSRVLENIRKALRILYESAPAVEHPLICVWSGDIAGNCDVAGNGGLSGNIGAVPMQRRLCERSRALFKAIREEQPDEINRALRGLAGLGNGLTPAGDDLLAGLINGAHFLERCARDENELPGVIVKKIGLMVESGELQTTWLSSKFLKWAASGRLAEEALTFCECISGIRPGSLEECASHFLTYGASSGREIMLGITGAFMHLFIQTGGKRGTAAGNSQ